MTNLPEPGAALAGYQCYVEQILKERGFDDETVEQKFMLFTEEVGELAKAIRKSSGVKYAGDSKHRDLLEEAGDVLILFLDLCNKLGISAEEALRVKEAKNNRREWK